MTFNIAAVVVTMATEYHCMPSPGLTDVLLTALELACLAVPLLSFLRESVSLDSYVRQVSVRMRLCVHRGNLAAVFSIP